MRSVCSVTRRDTGIRVFGEKIGCEMTFRFHALAICRRKSSSYRLVLSVEMDELTRIALYPLNHPFYTILCVFSLPSSSTPTN